MRRWLRLGSATALLLSAALVVLSAQESPQSSPRTGAISGVVTDGPGGAPVAGAQVSLAFQRAGVAGLSREVQQTDAKGRFVFTGLAPGESYRLQANAAGFAQGAYGRTSPDSRVSIPISLSAGQWQANLRILIWRYGSISGYVTDERGEPLVGVMVGTLFRIRLAGVSQLGTGPVVATDDRGQYRFPGLPTGSYFVYVPTVQRSVPSTTPAALLSWPAARPAGISGNPVPGTAPVPAPSIDLTETTRVIVGGYPVPPRSVDGKPLAYPLTFSGGATSIDLAQPIDVTPGVARDGQDIRLLPVPAAIVHGVVDTAGGPKAELTVRLLAPGLEDVGLGTDTAVALAGADGAFVIGPVPIGAYTLEATTSPAQFALSGMRIFNMYSLPGMLAQGLIEQAHLGMNTSVSTSQPVLSGRVPAIAAAAPGPPVTVPLRPAPTLRGEIRLEIDPNHPFRPEIERYLAIDEASGRARTLQRLPSEADEFAFRVLPGAYFLRSTSATLMIKSVMYDGRDYAHLPIQVFEGSDLSGIVVTVTNASPKLTGMVRARTGAPTMAAVVAFPPDPGQWTRYGSTPARIRPVLSRGSGQYEVTQLPPGDYFVIAVPLDQAEAWREPEFLARASALATRVSIGWGDTRSHDLTLVEIR
jgi:hypothetical protein